MSDKPDARKIALLLTVAGPDAIDVYNTFHFRPAAEGVEDEDPNKFTAVIGKFDAYCTPYKNETYDRYLFNTHFQDDSEPFEIF